MVFVHPRACLFDGTLAAFAVLVIFRVETFKSFFESTAKFQIAPVLAFRKRRRSVMVFAKQRCKRPGLFRQGPLCSVEISVAKGIDPRKTGHVRGTGIRSGAVPVAKCDAVVHETIQLGGSAAPVSPGRHAV